MAPMNPTGDAVRIALAQMVCDVPRETSLERAVTKIEEAANHGARVILLPELFRSRYFAQHVDESVFDLAESIPGPTTERLAPLARDLGVVILAPLFERALAGLYYNSAVLIDADGRIAAHYRKAHIPEDPCFHEKYYFRPGEERPKCVDTRYGRIGVAICWDQWFPETARLLALDGAELIVFPTAIGWLPGEDGAVAERMRDAWTTIQRAHAIANGAYVAAINRVGQEDAIHFWGASFVADPIGAVVACADGNEQTLLVDCDFGLVESTRRTWPFLRDRRVDLYGPLTGGPESSR
jgi:N-carbamoylputrescine amidase